MANQEQLDRLLTQGVQAWNAWRAANPDVQVDLNGADLRGVDLVRANLFDADLSSADLSEATLFDADLSTTVALRWSNPTPKPVREQNWCERSA